MERADAGLAFMLQYENVAWYENGQVRILDRRVYPGKVEFVVCHDHHEVAQAIADMVTQSCGPFTAAAAGMALAAYECRNQKPINRIYTQDSLYLEVFKWVFSAAEAITTIRFMESSF